MELRKVLEDAGFEIMIKPIKSIPQPREKTGIYSGKTQALIYKSQF
jgi:hypothetical protein